MNAKMKAAGAAAALLGIGAVKACSKLALVAGHTGGETAAIGLSHSAPTAIHAMEFGAGDTASLARSALHQTDTLAGSAHTLGDAAASSGDDVSKGVTHDTDHEPGFLHEAGKEIAKESIKRALEPDRENRNDPRPYESLYRNSDGVTGSTEGSR